MPEVYEKYLQVSSSFKLVRIDNVIDGKGGGPMNPAMRILHLPRANDLLERLMSGYS